MEQRRKSSYYQIKSIVKAFNLLELLVSKKEFQVAQLCQQLNSPKTTVHRMLLTLESLGYVQQNPRTRGYMCSMKIFELAGNVVQNLNFVEIAKPLMTELSLKTGETINLGVLDGIDVVCVDKVESNHELKLDQPIGQRAKAYHTAMGKAALAYLPDEERARLFSKHTLTLYTSKSLKTVDAIEEELQRVRQQGYAVDNEEYVMGVRCVGAPIFDRNSKVVAGLSIAAPSLRIKEENMKSLAKLVSETAALVSKRLGVSQGGLIGSSHREREFAGRKRSNFPRVFGLSATDLNRILTFIY